MLEVEDVGKKEQRNQEKILSINSVSFVLFYFVFFLVHSWGSKVESRIQSFLLDVQ